MSIKEYNGHESWDFWNVSLWINNDETAYRQAYALVQLHGYSTAAKTLASDLVGTTTPDGAKYTYSNIRRALRGMLD